MEESEFIRRTRRPLKKEVKKIGGQKVPVYCEGVDESRADELIRRFCIKHYEAKEGRYELVLNDGNSYLFATNEFLFLFYVMLQEDGIVFKGKNISPFCTRLKTLLGDASRTIDRSGLTRMKNRLEGNIFNITTGTLPPFSSEGLKATVEYYREPYLIMKKAWEELKIDDFAH